MSRPGLIDPLRRAAFRRLSLSYAVNELGDWMGIVALSVLVFDQTQSALATTLLFLGNYFFPALLTPVVVARLEQPPPRIALPAIYVGEALLFGALALLVDNFSLAAIVVLATLDGALALSGRSLTRAVAAAMLQDDGELRGGNAILNVAFTGGAAVGPAIAGAAVAGLGIQTALLLDSASFLAIALILLTADRLPQAAPEPGRVIARLRAGVSYIRRSATLRRLLGAQSAALIFFSAVLPIEVVYAKETLGVGDAGYGLLLASWGGGMVLGSLVFATLRRVPLSVLLFASTLGVGLGYVVMGVAPTLAFACAGAALGGLGNGVQWVTAVSAVQELTVGGMQARVLAVLESIASAALGIGFLLGGVLATLLDTRVTFITAGAGVFAIVLVATPVLGRKWPANAVGRSSEAIDAGEEIMVELIPAEAMSTLDRREFL